MTRTALKLIWISGILIIFATGASSWAEHGRGPLRLRNQYPLHWLFLTPAPDTPDLLPRGNLRLDAALDYSNILLWDRSEDWSFLMDMENAVFTVSAAYGLFDWATLECEVPFISMRGGFMDGFLENYHDFLGVKGYGRKDLPGNVFSYFFYKEGKVWFEAEPGGWYPGESIVRAKVALLRETSAHGWAAAASYALKIPTGDPDRGVGSGNWDHGLFLFVKRRVASFYVYANGGCAFIGDPRTAGADVSARPIGSAFLGLEYLWLTNWSILAQVSYYTSPIENTGLSTLDDPSVELGLGVIGRIAERTDVELTLGEDLFGQGAPDFTLHLAFRKTF